MNSQKILVVDDEIALRRFMKSGLIGSSYTVIEAETAEQALEMAAKENPELILLDLGLPDLDGLVVIERIREWSQTPIIILSARGKDQDKIAGLDAGANDYLTKPFSMGELLARIRVALRAGVAPKADGAVLDFGGLTIDQGKHEVFVDGEIKRLTAIEFKLLVLLARHEGRVLTHRFMLREVWGPLYDDATHTLRVHMGNLRHKIEKDPARPRFIRTEIGVGYRLISAPSG